jgi:putative MFS transporter
MSNWQRWLTLIVGIGSFFDLYEVFLGGVLAPVLAKQWALDSTGKSAVIACAFTGMFVGANFMSVLADRFGRRNIFILNLASYAVLSVASAFSPNLTVFVILRFFCGIGVGSELVLVDTYLAEFLPARLRGRYIAWAYTVGFLGVPVAALFGAHVVAKNSFAGVDGWRWLLIAGGLGAVFVVAVQKSLPESPRWLAARGRGADAAAVVDDIERKVRRSLGRRKVDYEPAPRAAVEAVEQQRVPLADMFRTYRSRTIMLWIFQILQTVGYYGFGSMAPLVLTAKGFTITDSLGYAALTYIGYPVGSLLSIPLVERFERKHLIVVSAVGSRRVRPGLRPVDEYGGHRHSRLPADGVQQCVLELVPYLPDGDLPDVDPQQRYRHGLLTVPRHVGGPAVRGGPGARRVRLGLGLRRLGGAARAVVPGRRHARPPRHDRPCAGGGGGENPLKTLYPERIMLTRSRPARLGEGHF